MRKNIWRAIRVFFILLLVSILFYLYLPPQWNAITNMKKEIGEEKADIVFIGSSHVFNGINPILLWDEQGFFSYVAACGGQAPWQSYAYIKAVNNLEHPQIIVLDVYCFGIEEPRLYDYNHTLENMLTYPFGIEKYKTLRESKIDNIADVMVVFPIIHDNYEQIKGLSINKVLDSNWVLGYSYRIGECNETLTPFDAIYTDELAPIDTKCEIYLNKCITYCKENNIELVLINSPWPRITEDDQKKYNYIAQIAANSDILFLDGNKEMKSLNIDYMQDSYDGSHLNYYGACKWTKYLGNEICKYFSVRNRRGEAKYESIMQRSREKLKKQILVTVD